MLRAIVIVASLWAVALYLFVALHRIRYPYELEWMEGGMVDHVARILHGQRIYVRPSLAFTPFVYPIVYYYVSAAAASVFGLGFLALRVVSFVSSLGTFALLAVLVRRETRSWTAAIAAVGVLAGSFPLSGGWFDLGRVDSLFLLLLIASVGIARRFQNVAGACAAAFVLTIAFHTKQSALIVAAALALALALTSLRRALLFSGCFVAGVTASSLWLERLHGGWYGFYTIAVVRGHAIANEMHAIFWRDEVLRPCGFAVALTLAFLLIPSASLRGGARSFYAVVLAGLLTTAWLSRIHSGGWINVLIPAHVALAMGAAFGLHALLDAGGGLLARRGAWIGAVLLLLQIGSLSYDPRAFIPTAADKAAGDDFLARLRQTPGDVLLTHHGYLSALAGKPTFAHHMAVIDLMRSTADAVGAKEGLRAEFEAALRTHRFSEIVIDNGDSPFLDLIERYYRDSGRWPYPSRDVFFPPSGAHIRPEVVFTPREIETDRER